MASTKSFTSTVAAFALLALHLGRMRDLSPSTGKRIVDGLKALPAKIAEILELDDEIAKIARDLAPQREHAVHRAPARLPGGARGRAEAQGDLLHPRRGLRVGRAQARAAGAGQPGDADRRRRARRRPVREEHLDAGRDQGPPRPGDRGGAPRAACGPGRPHDRRARSPRTSWTRSCCRSRCSCWPTTRRWRWSATSTSPATWPRASRSSSRSPSRQMTGPRPGSRSWDVAESPGLVPGGECDVWGRPLGVPFRYIREPFRPDSRVLWRAFALMKILYGGIQASAASRRSRWAAKWGRRRSCGRMRSSSRSCTSRSSRPRGWWA